MQLLQKACLLLALVCSIEATCLHPPLPADYVNIKYQGGWYEIGRIQTPGGAFYQRNCVCDVALFNFENPISGNGNVTYVCRNQTVDGVLTPISGLLIAGEIPGNFNQVLYSAVDYNVIWLDEDSAIEYDCGKPFFEEYCIHFMSRTPMLHPEKFEAMMNFTIELGLNTRNLEYKPVLQEGCW